MDEEQEEKKETTPAKDKEPEKKVDEIKEPEKEPEKSETEDLNKPDQEEQEPDWKKVADEEREAREKAEKALAGDRFKKSEAKRKDPKPEEKSDSGATTAQIAKMLDERDAKIRKETMSSEVKKIAKELAGSDDEAGAIVEIYNNRTFPSGLSLERQLQEAYAIAHMPRVLAKNEELRRSLRSKDTKKSGSNENTHRDVPKGKEPELSPQDKLVIQKAGWKWEGKQYMKKLPNGKVLGKKSLKDRPYEIKG